jgi:CBS-domain-containing membrane protein
VRIALALLLAAAPLAARAQTPPPARSLFLEVEPSFWGQYGLKVLRNGEEVGPGYLAMRMSDLVRGSWEAERHATHARIWAGFALGLGLTAAVLAAGALVVYVEALPSPTDSDIARQFSLLGGSLISSLIGVLCGLNVPIETAAAVSAYNRDMLFGVTGGR